MPRYIVERTFPGALEIPMDGDGAQQLLGVVDKNAGHGVTWVHSYFNTDRTASWCVYDGPTPESIREAAESSRLPVDKITEVRVLDPYFFH
jgi:hypothetical protein